MVQWHLQEDTDLGPVLVVTLQPASSLVRVYVDWRRRPTLQNESFRLSLYYQRPWRIHGMLVEVKTWSQRTGFQDQWNDSWKSTRVFGRWPHKARFVGQITNISPVTKTLDKILLLPDDNDEVWARH